MNLWILWVSHEIWPTKRLDGVIRPVLRPAQAGGHREVARCDPSEVRRRLDSPFRRTHHAPVSFCCVWCIPSRHPSRFSGFPRGCVVRRRSKPSREGRPATTRTTVVPGSILSRPWICTETWPAPCVLSLIHISEPTRRTPISYAVFCLKKKK